MLHYGYKLQLCLVWETLAYVKWLVVSYDCCQVHPRALLYGASKLGSLLGNTSIDQRPWVWPFARSCVQMEKFVLRISTASTLLIWSSASGPNKLSESKCAQTCYKAAVAASKQLTLTQSVSASKQYKKELSISSSLWLLLSSCYCLQAATILPSLSVTTTKSSNIHTSGRGVYFCV